MSLSKIKESIADALAVVIVWFMLKWDDIKDTIVTVAVTVGVCLLVTNYFFKPVAVKGTSMYPTIEDGSIGFSSVISRSVSGIKRFDIVVVHLDAKNENLIKRVIGLPGETITYLNGELYVDGQHYTEDFLDSVYVSSQIGKKGSRIFTQAFSYTLGDDEYFCMGDNRLVSSDSRRYGPFKGSDILSRGLFVIYPLDHFGNCK